MGIKNGLFASNSTEWSVHCDLCWLISDRSLTLTPHIDIQHNLLLWVSLRSPQRSQCRHCKHICPRGLPEGKVCLQPTEAMFRFIWVNLWVRCCSPSSCILFLKATECRSPTKLSLHVCHTPTVSVCYSMWSLCSRIMVKPDHFAKIFISRCPTKACGCLYIWHLICCIRYISTNARQMCTFRFICFWTDVYKVKEPFLYVITGFLRAKSS